MHYLKIVLSGTNINLSIYFSVLGGDLTNITGSTVEPRYVWSNHSLPVTDVYVGYGAIRSRVVTSSVDQTCRVSPFDVSVTLTYPLNQE